MRPYSALCLPLLLHTVTVAAAAISRYDLSGEPRAHSLDLVANPKAQIEGSRSNDPH